MPGAPAVFEKFAGYVPRDEKADWLAGGKRMNFDRIEWQIMPDAATAAAALQNGEVDWWETPIPDLVPLLKKNRNIAVDIADPLGNIGIVPDEPPASAVQRRAGAPGGADRRSARKTTCAPSSATTQTLWKPLPGFFTPGTPLYTEDGGEHAEGQARHRRGARSCWPRPGYKGEPRSCMVVGTDVPITKAQGDVTADLLKQIGMNVRLSWRPTGAPSAQRRARKEPPSTRAAGTSSTPGTPAPIA